MELNEIDYVGPPIDDPETLARLPEDLVELLEQVNGFRQFGGGLHVRGACLEPAWHALRSAMVGDDAFYKLYPDEVDPSDVPFAEDCLGDQYLLRGGLVWQLVAETGEVEPMDLTLEEFLQAAQDDPEEFLCLNPLSQYRRDGDALDPGELLSNMPPFCVAESAEGVTLEAVPALDRRRFLADLAARVRELPEGGTLRFDPPGA